MVISLDLLDMLQNLTLVHYTGDILLISLNEQEVGSTVVDNSHKDLGMCWDIPFELKDPFIQLWKRNHNAPDISVGLEVSIFHLWEHCSYPFAKPHGKLQALSEVGLRAGNGSTLSPECGISSFVTWSMQFGNLMIVL
jgi:hypothetical protein